MISWAKSVEENILKAHHAFFHYGSIGVFQGDISPLSSKSVLECCVMLILMYRCENWILTERLIDKLEAFQGELVKSGQNITNSLHSFTKHIDSTSSQSASRTRPLRFPELLSITRPRKPSFVTNNIMVGISRAVMAAVLERSQLARSMWMQSSEEMQQQPGIGDSERSHESSWKRKPILSTVGCCSPSVFSAGPHLGPP